MFVIDASGYLSVCFKVYRDEVYVTVPRWRRGIPSSLNRVVTRGDKHLLQPYPSWAMNRMGDCSVLQYVQSMEIDPNTGYMYILDNGRINIFENSSTNVCPPKLLIWNMQKNAEVHRYVFPADVADPTSCFLNDIVLDYVDGHVAFAYITDVLEAKLYVYDYNKDESYVFKDPSMQPESPGGYAVDGIAMSPTFDFVYFCPITGRGLYQVGVTLEQCDTRTTLTLRNDSSLLHHVMTTHSHFTCTQPHTLMSIGIFRSKSASMQPNTQKAM